ncbi:MAG: RNA polymerase sigma factor [Planctomycetota bacterium]|jgi:RNA polymerase sigma-70 factor (ECF subfamily)
MAEPIDDDLLVERFSRGDESAFERIVERYSADVAALANRLLAWPGDVEDVTQDVFLAVFLGLKKFRRDCRLKTWLFAITINKCRSNRHRRCLHLRRFSQAAGETLSVPAATEQAGPMEAEDLDRVRRAVAALPVRYREPVVLRYLQELPTDEIGRILGISQNALQVRLSRARKRLKQDLAELIE